MAKTLQFRRGTTAELSSVTGAVGELFVDTTKDTVVVMDGSTAGGKPLATEEYVGTAISNLVDSAPGALDTLNELAAALNDDANFSTSISNTVTTTGDYANSAFSKANTALIHAQAAFNAANTGGGSGGGADFSNITEDVLPSSSNIYDIGSTDKRWYNGYFSNKVDIDGAEILGSSDGVVIPSAALVDQLLISDNMITPDDTSVRQYFGDKGVVIINGNLDVQGDWLGAPVVQTLPEIIGQNIGDFDTDFIAANKVNGPVESIGTQSDGKILVAGFFSEVNGITRACIARLNADGTSDTSFNTGGDGFNTAVKSLVVQPDDKIICGGVFTFYNGPQTSFSNPYRYIIRLNADGTVDNTFTSNMGIAFNNTVQDLALQPDGKIVVVGSFNSFNGTSQNGITRLNADGTIDSTFANNIGSGFNAGAVTVALQPDGKILVGGVFTSFNGTSQNYITRLNADGTLDTTFANNIGSGFNGGTPETIALQSDGKILVGGYFSSFNGTPRTSIIRLNADGTLDTNFNTGGDGFNNVVVRSVLVQDNDKILVGIDYITVGVLSPVYNGTEVGTLCRLNADGTLDTTLNTSFNDTNDSILTIKILNDGKILVGGGVGMFVNGTFQRILVESIEAQTASIVPVGGEEGFIRYNKDITAFQAYNGTSWELLERVTTPPTNLATTGTVDIDFSGAVLRKQGVLTGDITYTGSNYLPGSTVTIRLVTGETNCNLGFPTGWVFVGEVPTTLGANKTAILTVTSFGTTESDCVAAWAEQA